MKSKIAIIILAIVCVGLAIGLFATKKQGEDLHNSDVSSITVFSNQLLEANGQLKDLSQINLALTNDLAANREQILDFSNALAAAKASLTDTKTTLADAQTQITNLNVQISDLEAQNKVLDQRATELTNTIAQLSEQIDKTSIQLAIAETNRDYLSGELEKQMAQKAELEHKFNDLNEVRSQVKKLKDEMYIARRLELMKYDNSNKKGGELLMSRSAPVTNSAAKTPANYDLNVEVGSDGSVKVIPPIGATNQPAH